MTDLAQLKAQIQATSAELEAEERRFAEAKEKLDARRTSLRRQALASFRTILDGYRKQAATALDAAAERLGKVGPEPVKPKPGDVDTLGFEAFCAASEGYTAAKEAHSKAMLEAAAPLIPALQGLHHLAKNAGAECVALGLVTAVLGLIPYHVVTHLRGHERLGMVLGAASHGVLAASDARDLAALFRMPEPEQGQPIRCWTGSVEVYKRDARAELRS